MRPITFIIFALMFSLPGCVSDRPDPTLGIEWVTAALSAPCVADSNFDSSFPPNADSAVIRLTGGSLSEPFVSRITDNGASFHVVTGITPGENMTLEIVGCSGSDAVWAGLTDDVSVAANQKTFPKVFLTPIGSQTVCVPHASGLKHAFGTAVQHGDDVYILGGASSYTEVGTNKRYAVGGKSLSKYSRYTATVDGLNASTSLQDARLLGLGYAQEDGTILLIGGATKLQFLGTYYDLWTPADSAPSCAIEQFDPATETSVCLTTADIPAGSSAARLANGTTVLAGGTVAGDNEDTASKSLWVISSDQEDKLEMPVARFGSNVIPLDDTHVLVWGGNVDGIPAQAGLILNTETRTISEPAISGNSSVPIWAAAAYAGKASNGAHRVLIAGGGQVPAFSEKASGILTPTVARLDLLTIDTTEGTVTVEAVSYGEEPDQANRFKRALASLVSSDGETFWLVGGINDWLANDDVCKDDEDRCFPWTMSRFSIDTSVTPPQLIAKNGANPELSVGGLGAIPIPLTDGSALVVSGFSRLSEEGLGGNAALVRYASQSADLCQSVP